MKKRFQYLKLFLPAFVVLTALGSYARAQKQFTHTATKENNYCNSTCTLLDVPELNNNPNAVILVTTLKNNTPIMAYYIKTKKDVSQWSIINMDNSTMAPGTQYKVEYYLQPDDKNFVHVVTRENNVINEGESKKKGSYIDHAALNNNPGAQIRYFQNWAPALRGGLANRYDIKIQYDSLPGRWYIYNTNGRALDNSTAYNIIIANQSNTVTVPVNTNRVNINPPNTVSNQASPSGTIIELYMTVWANGIKVAGDNVRKGFLDKIQIWGFEMGGATSTDQSTGRRRYEPVTVKNTMGVPSTLPLFDAFVKNQNLTITIETYSTLKSTGATEINYTIKLTGARVVSFKQMYDEAPHLNSKEKKLTNEMKITFTKIEFEKDGVVVEDNL